MSGLDRLSYSSDSYFEDYNPSIPRALPKRPRRFRRGDAIDSLFLNDDELKSLAHSDLIRHFLELRVAYIRMQQSLDELEKYVSANLDRLRDPEYQKKRCKDLSAANKHLEKRNSELEVIASELEPTKKRNTTDITRLEAINAENIAKIASLEAQAARKVPSAGVRPCTSAAFAVENPIIDVTLKQWANPVQNPIKALMEWS
ncbi:hypothetical protein DSL72_007591 [Monilinia vaccinii-corymbosi]|uniref:Uncharacterized protein n=1 Tax=Monilinia vaccinii-corymbosi TaxID=61207 RepID=A0A8A3PIF0_9HELO|nr:hypothetical protein DSL72_007591 [Monilinia vaccinii-corymbosi]